MTEGAHAIPFIIKNPQSQLYELNPDAQQFLKSLTTPLSIISVAGLYRTGKSYLLNRVILNKSQGFSVGPTINPCTKGLWIWNQKLSAQQQSINGQQRSVLVIDTEGLGALDQQANHDMKIFCLAVLLSTTFIYNSVGNIDENALQTLSLVLNLISNIDQQNASSKPSFIWVVRDFSLQLIDQKGNSISPKQYLQLALSSQHVKQSQKSQIRKTITSAFKQRDCFTLYKPLIDQNKLQKLDLIPLQQLRPEFVSQTMALRKKIFGGLHEIKLGGQILCGNEYVLMVKRYLKAINQGKVPNLMDTWAFIKEEKGRQVAYELIEEYSEKAKSKIMGRLPMKFNQLQDLMGTFVKELSQEFSSLVYESTQLPEQLQQFISRLRVQIKTTNEEQTRQFIKNLLTREFENFSKKLFSDHYKTMEEFSGDVQKNFRQLLVQNYADKVEGMNGSVSGFLQKKYFEGFRYFEKKMKLEIKRVEESKEQIQIELRREIQQVKTSSSEYQTELKQKLVEMDKKVIELNRKLDQGEHQLQLQRQSKHSKQQESLTIVSSLQQQLNQTQQQYLLLQKQKDQSQSQLFMLKKQTDKELALMKQKNEYLSRQLQQSQRRHEQMKKILDEKMFTQEQQRKKFLNSSQERLRQLMLDCQTKGQRIVQLQSKLLQIKQKYEQRIDQMQRRERKLLQEKQKAKQSMIEDFSNKKQHHSQQLVNLRQECTTLQQQLQLSLLQRSQLQTRAKHLSEQLKHVQYNSEKQIAIHLQRIQFHETEIRQLKLMNEETKKNYNQMLETIQTASRTTEERLNTKISELTEGYERQIKAMEKELSEKVYEAKKEFAGMKAAKEERDIELALERKKHQAKQAEFKESYAKLEELYNTLVVKLSTSEKDYHSLNQQNSLYFTNRIKQLELQLEQIKEKSMRELEESQKSSEEALGVLKNYAEMERQQWEKRLIDEKDRNVKNVQQLKVEWERRLVEEKQALEEENSMLEDKISEMERYFTEVLQNMKYDHDIQKQKLSNQLTSQITQLKKQSALLSQQLNLTKTTSQQQLQDLRRTSEATICQMKSQHSQELEAVISAHRQEKEFLQSKVESLKKSNKQLEQQNLILKSEMDKDRSVWKEKENNHLRNINDLEEKLSVELFNHTRTIEQITTANNVQRKRLNGQIDQLKTSKNRLQEQKATLVMEKDALESKLNSKITYLQGKLKNGKLDYDDLMNKFSVTSTCLNAKIQKLMKEKQELANRSKQEFDQQIAAKQQTYKGQVKQLNDRTYRLGTQNKSLRDKIILLELKLSSSQTRQLPQTNDQFQQLERQREEYLQREEEYRKVIDKLKREKEKLAKEKEILEMTVKCEKNSRLNERDSIINGLNDNSRMDRSGRHQQSKMNMSNLSNYNNGNGQFNQSRISMASNFNNALLENKTLNNANNRKSSVSPLMMNKPNINQMPRKSSNLIGNNNMMNKNVGRRDYYDQQY